MLYLGLLGETKGVNLPGCVVRLPAVTDKDRADIAFGVRQGVDFIAASFIRKAADVLADFDYLRRDVVPTGATGGRPRDRDTINPAVLGMGGAA